MLSVLSIAKQILCLHRGRNGDLDEASEVGWAESTEALRDVSCGGRGRIPDLVAKSEINGGRTCFAECVHLPPQFIGRPPSLEILETPHAHIDVTITIRAGFER